MPRLLPLAALTLLALTGCGHQTSLLEPLMSSGPTLSAADFRAPDAPHADLNSSLAAAPAPALASDTTPSGTPLPPNPAVAANDAVPVNVEAIPGSPDLTTGAPAPVEEASLLDIKVGDINGRPIFASDFFAEFEDRLIAESRQLTRQNWTAEVRGGIRLRLKRLIDDELLRAEALESIPTAVREAGLRRFFDANRANVQSQAGGSLTAAQQRLLEESGLTLEEWLRQRRDEQLVNMSVQTIVEGVQVSGRDIRNYYERNYDTYNPQPRARFRQITVGSDNAAGVAQVTEALAAGTPFTDIASRQPNSFNRATGGLIEIAFDGELTQATLFTLEPLNNAARALTPGQWVGPIVYGNNGVLTSWLYLETIDRSTRSLYEAQIEISGNLKLAQAEERRDQLVARLRQRASFTSEEEMAQRLLQIALARYYPPNQPEPQQRPGIVPRP